MTNKIEPAWRNYVPVAGVYLIRGEGGGQHYSSYVQHHDQNPTCRYYGPIDIPEPPPDLAGKTLAHHLSHLLNVASVSGEGPRYLKQVIEAYGGKVPEESPKTP